MNLVEAIILNPTEGIGKPEHLKFFPGSKWSRRITQEHRLVYQISSDKIIFFRDRCEPLKKRHFIYVNSARLG
jgi:toxin YoeB